MINSNSYINDISDEEFNEIIETGVCPNCDGNLVIYHPSGDIGCQTCNYVYRKPKKKAKTLISYPLPKKHSSR